MTMHNDRVRISICENQTLIERNEHKIRILIYKHLGWERKPVLKFDKVEGFLECTQSLHKHQFSNCMFYCIFLQSARALNRIDSKLIVS